MIFPLAVRGMTAIIGLPIFNSLQQPEPSHQSRPSQSESQQGIAGQAWAESVAKKDHYEGKQEGQWYSTFLDHTPDWFVAIFTALLTCVTYRLVKSTNKLWEAGERQIEVARQSADAATASAEYLAAVERAYVFTSLTPFPDGHNRTNYQITVYNTGSTPAVIERVQMQFAEHVPTGPPSYNGDGNEFDIFIAEGASAVVGQGNPAAPIPMIWQANFAPAITQWAFGFVIYRDVFKKSHTTKFCYVVNPMSQVEAIHIQRSGTREWNDFDWGEPDDSGPCRSRANGTAMIEPCQRSFLISSTATAVKA